MSESKNYFSLLPPDIVQDIFDSVQAQEKPILASLSKHLLPFQQKPLFHHLVLDSYEDLEMLCDTTQRIPALATYVDHLHINIDFTFVPHQEVPTESNDPLVPSSDQLQDLFHALTDITTLSISGSHRLATSILTQEMTRDCFPKLVKLSFTSSFPQFDDPFNAAHYTVLSSFMKLEAFLLSVFRDPSTIHPNLQTSSPVPLSTQLECLRLVGPLTSSASSTKHLIGSSSSITSLTLIDTSGKSPVTELLEGSQHSDKLLELELNRSPAHGPISTSSLVGALSRCPNLESISLGGSCSSTSPSFYSALLALPLETLTFGYKAQVSLEQLTKLVIGSTKHRTLRSITLDNVFGQIGTTIEEAGEPYAGSEVYPDWRLPEWTDTFTRRGLVEFLRIVEFEGVEVDGTALEAVRVEREFEKELEIIEDWSE